MSLGGERIQGKPGSPIPLGYGRGVTAGVADFFHPDSRLKLRNYSVSGITKDSTGAALGNCVVEVFETLYPDNRRFVSKIISDSTGNYKIFVPGPDTGMTFQAIAYKAGAPDVAGITVNTLVGIEGD